MVICYSFDDFCFNITFKGALCEGGDILKMKESAFSEVNLATKNH